MKCFQCGELMIPKTGLYQFDDEYTGIVSVTLKDSLECKHCKEILLSLEDAQRMEDAEKIALEEELQKQPVSAYISASEAMKILEMKTKQSFYQHRRIKRGFIFQTQFDGRKMYLRDSVERYKETGDGRFRLIMERIPPIEFDSRDAENLKISISPKSEYITSENDKYIHSFPKVTQDSWGIYQRKTAGTGTYG